MKRREEQLRSKSRIYDENISLSTNSTGGEVENDKAKLGRMRTRLESDEPTYEHAIYALSEAEKQWAQEWGNACDEFQQIEEQRITEMKTTVWNYVNLLSQTCVTDDESCERIRLALEGCDIDKEIQTFIAQQKSANQATVHTGQGPQLSPEIPRHSYSKSLMPEISRNVKPYKDEEVAMASNEGSTVIDSSVYAPRRSPARTPPRTVLRESPKSIINQHPLDGITQLCRSDSSATFNSISNSAVGSSVTASSVYSSIQGSAKHTPTTSLTNHPLPASNSTVRQPTRRKSFIERVDFSWPNRRSSIPSKPESPKPLKAQRTGGSMFDALRPARSRSRASVRADSLDRDVDVPLASDPRATNILNIGKNMLPITSSSLPGETERLAEYHDPIADALAKLKLSSRPTSAIGSRENVQKLHEKVDREIPQSHRAMQNRSHSHGNDTNVSGHIVYNSRQHPNTYSSSNARHSGLGAPPAAHSAEEMRQIADRFTYSKDVALNGRSERDDYSVHSNVSNPQFRQHEATAGARPRSSQFSSRYSQVSAPGDLRRSPSPNPHAGVILSSSRNSQNRPLSRQSQPETSYSPPLAPFGRQYNSSTRIDTEFRHPDSYTELGQRPRSRSPSARSQRPVSPLAQSANDRIRSRSRQSSSSNRSNGSTNTAMFRGSERSPSKMYGDSRYDPTRGREAPLVLSDSTYRPLNRTRSRSFVDPRSKFTPDGQEILLLVVALYDYQATIPEEIGFCQGDTLAIVEMRQDGWWLGQITNTRTPRLGLVPSNFFRKI